MPLPLLIMTVLATAQNPSGVSDYFPLASGAHWVYSCTTDGASSEVTYTAGKAVKFGKDSAVPIEVDAGISTTKLFYRIYGDAVELVSDDPKQPFYVSRPVLELDAPANKWHYDYLQNGEPVNVQAEIVKRGTERIFGQDLDVIVVRMDAKLGGDKHKVEIDQTLTYAKGIGLSRMEMRQMAGGSTHTMEMELKSFALQNSKP